MGVILLFVFGIYMFIKYCQQSAIDGNYRGQMKKRRSVLYHDSKGKMRNTATGKIWTRSDDELKDWLFGECKRLAKMEMNKQIILHNEKIRNLIDSGMNFKEAFETEKRRLFSIFSVEQSRKMLYGGFYEEFIKAGERHHSYQFDHQINFFLNDMANYLMYPYWERIYKTGKIISPLEEHGYGKIVDKAK